METLTHLSAAEVALVSTIYDPPWARRPWMLKDVLPEGATKYYSLARWALVDALRACGVCPGDRVLVPGLICREVLASINVVGAIAAFYPVSPQLCAGFNVGDLTQAKAVLAVNYFGFPQELVVFRQYCEGTGAALIEDNAHGLLSRDEDGQLLGSRGDAGIFSFRKTIAVPDGGALVLRGDRTLPHAQSKNPSKHVGSRYRLKQGFRRVAGPLGPVRAYKAITAMRRVRRWFTGASVPAGEADAETRIPVGPDPSALIGRPLAAAEPDGEVRRRRDLYELAARIVVGSHATPVFPCLPSSVVPYGFPLFVHEAQRSATAAVVGAYGFQLVQWPDLPKAVTSVAPEHYSRLMVLPFLW